MVANAEPRALIVGIGHYLLPNAELPGIAEDVGNMRGLAMIMGFRSDQIHILQDNEATLQRVIGEVSTWLREGVGADDPVLFYFSGHGTQIPDQDGDEPDKSDEALVMHDTTRSSALPGFRNLLVDDQIAQLVGRIPSQRVLLLLDACNSGTATRSVDLSQFQLGAKKAFRKFYGYDGMPKGESIAIHDESDAPGNFAALSAAGDSESALSFPAGSVFTLGLAESIRSAAQTRQELSIEQLRREVDAYINVNVEPKWRYHPVTSGRADLIAGGLKLIPLESGNGPTWDEFQALATRGEPIKLSANRARYKVGEEVEIKIDSPRPGYLNVISIDSTDNATVLFPNTFQAENFIGPGTFIFPTTDMPFTLPAIEPLGRTLIVVYLSEIPVSALELGIEGRDYAGRFTETFTGATMMAQRAIGVAARTGRFFSGALEVTVEPRD